MQIHWFRTFIMLTGLRWRLYRKSSRMSWFGWWIYMFPHFAEKCLGNSPLHRSRRFHFEYGRSSPGDGSVGSDSGSSLYHLCVSKNTAVSAGICPSENQDGAYCKNIEGRNSYGIAILPDLRVQHCFAAHCKWIWYISDRSFYSNDTDWMIGAANFCSAGSRNRNLYRTDYGSWKIWQKFAWRSCGHEDQRVVSVKSYKKICLSQEFTLKFNLWKIFRLRRKAMFYTVGEMTKLLGFPVSTLRYYDKDGAAAGADGIAAAHTGCTWLQMLALKKRKHPFGYFLFSERETAHDVRWTSAMRRPERSEDLERSSPAGLDLSKKGHPMDVLFW